MKSGHIIRRLRFSLQCVVLIALAATPAGAATNVVTTLADNGPGSLRDAISNSLSGDTIIFSTNGTIALTSGELFITNSLNIIGPGASNLAVSGNLVSRVLNLAAGITSSISGLTIRDGRTSNGWSGSPDATGEDGGSIFSLGTLALTNCVFANNRTGDGGVRLSGPSTPPGGNPPWSRGGPGGAGGSGGHGGAIYSGGTLAVGNCSFIGNATGDGRNGGNAVLLRHIGA